MRPPWHRKRRTGKEEFQPAMASKRAKLIQTRCGAASWRFSIPWVESRIQPPFSGSRKIPIAQAKNS